MSSCEEVQGIYTNELDRCIANKHSPGKEFEMAGRGGRDSFRNRSMHTEKNHHILQIAIHFGAQCSPLYPVLDHPDMLQNFNYTSYYRGEITYGIRETGSGPP